MTKSEKKQIIKDFAAHVSSAKQKLLKNTEWSLSLVSAKGLIFGILPAKKNRL